MKHPWGFCIRFLYSTYRYDFLLWTLLTFWIHCVDGFHFSVTGRKIVRLIRYSWRSSSYKRYRECDDDARNVWFYACRVRGSFRHVQGSFSFFRRVLSMVFMSTNVRVGQNLHLPRKECQQCNGEPFVTPPCTFCCAKDLLDSPRRFMYSSPQSWSRSQEYKTIYFHLKCSLINDHCHGIILSYLIKI